MATIESERHASLLAAVARGDDRALAELYDYYEKSLYSLGIRKLHDRQRAEELVQDTILKLWKSAASFDPAKGTASAWIFTVAQRSAIDIIRKERKTPVPLDPSIDRPADDDTEQAIWRAWEVGVALSALPEEQRRVVELGVIQGYTHVEIATALGVPLGTVKTRTYAGLRSLRKKLESLEVLEAPG